MPIAIAHLQSLSPYSQSDFIATKKNDNEDGVDWERRVWRERLHVRQGQVIIPATQFSAAVKAAAGYYQQKVPGTGGKGTYRKHFDSGVFVYEDVVLPIRAEEVEGEWLMLPPNPSSPRSGSRVPKCYPRIPTWEGMVTYTIYDQTITEAVFAEVLRISGIQIGIGRFRPSQKGIYGRYSVKELLWQSA